MSSFQICLENERVKYDGNWMRQKDNKKIKCRHLSGNELECEWPDKLVEKYIINDKKLTGASDPTVEGIYTDNGQISWNTGSIWVKQGKFNKRRTLEISKANCFPP